MKKLGGGYALVLLTVSCSCGYVLAQQAIPSSFFGLHVNQPDGNGDSFPLQVTYGTVRNWDVDKASWPDLNPSNGNFNFKVLDSLLSNVYLDNQHNGTNNVVEFTLARTPVWAQPTVESQPCGKHNGGPNYPGSCYPPKDLNTDGTGVNQIWRNWVAAIATCVNAPGYTNNHAPIKYWEIWNEFTNANFWAGAVTGQTQGVNGTTAQLVRMAEDANCIITGQVTTIIMNNNETCQNVWHMVGLQGAVDPTAQVVQPSIPDTEQPTLDALECFLYCRYPQDGKSGCPQDKNDHEQCAPQNSRTGADAINIIDFHHYDTNSNPEDFNTSNNIRSTGVLDAKELSKPLWVGEGSWGNSYDPNQTLPEPWWQDPYAQGGFVPRYFATIWSQTLPVTSSPTCDWSSEVCQQALWYGYDYNDTNPPKNFQAGVLGALYCAGNLLNGGQCNGGVPLLLQPQATMWNTAVSWLTGAKPDSGGSNAFCNLDPNYPTKIIWECDFKNNMTQYRMVWDLSQYQSAITKTSYCAATFPANPYLCGNTNYAVPPQYTRWQDLSGTTRNISNNMPFQVGLNPVLLMP